MAESLSTVSIKDSNNTAESIRTVEESGSGIHVSAVEHIPTAVGGVSTYRIISAATDNATVVKAAAGKLYGYRMASIDATAVFLKIYDKATAPTSSDTPILTIPVDGGNAAWDTPASEFFASGLALSNGLAFRMTTGLADSDTAAVAVNENVGALYYK